jgi:glyoxylase-like metal-dependent hydrolase (beta-lactamase superfamily II)
MKTTTHGKNLIKLTRYGMVNCYLVRDDDGFTLVDAGLPGSEKAILAEAQKYGIPIVRIALTHAHLDHIGSLDALKQALPDAEVIITAHARDFWPVI